MSRIIEAKNKLPVRPNKKKPIRLENKVVQVFEWRPEWIDNSNNASEAHKTGPIRFNLLFSFFKWSFLVSFVLSYLSAVKCWALNAFHKYSTTLLTLLTLNLHRIIISISHMIWIYSIFHWSLLYTCFAYWLKWYIYLFSVAKMIPFITTYFLMKWYENDFLEYQTQYQQFSHEFPFRFVLIFVCLRFISVLLFSQYIRWTNLESE